MNKNEICDNKKVGLYLRDWGMCNSIKNNFFDNHIELFVENSHAEYDLIINKNDYKG